MPPVSLHHVRGIDRPLVMPHGRRDIHILEIFSEDRILVTTLLHYWYERYGIAILIDQTWSDAYRRYFPGMGSPEAMNEANQRRFSEILAERGRLHKNSDDFPWVILKD
jgi:hypothetical protein